MRTVKIILMNSPETPTLLLIVGFDGTPSSCSALETARNLATNPGARLDVVYVSHPGAVEAMGPPGAFAAARDNEGAVAVDLRDVAATIVTARGRVEWAFHYRVGSVAHELLMFAAEIEEKAEDPADSRVLIIVGSADRRHDQLLSSVPRRLVRQNGIALVIVPARVH